MISIALYLGEIFCIFSKSKRMILPSLERLYWQKLQIWMHQLWVSYRFFWNDYCKYSALTLENESLKNRPEPKVDNSQLELAESQRQKALADLKSEKLLTKKLQQDQIEAMKELKFLEDDVASLIRARVL